MKTRWKSSESKTKYTLAALFQGQRGIRVLLIRYIHYLMIISVSSCSAGSRCVVALRQGRKTSTITLEQLLLSINLRRVRRSSVSNHLKSIYREEDYSQE
ncbi:hypothetical protein CHARACLAT_026773 [Characodon lateralis]|uniref:Uncharacterized protein n=1 Tax=Characodon lateralis TaxID=208331 RepID=A0ABU7F7E3_9TELE|nr:hypothetical protein [Characodon lateralis]